ncbi:50S ribosomal protein L3 [Candidatus Pacearchaeota archaeon]|nr:50S ribosomal protein L3 [Candidatus Pacearchaeota archaeon]
MAKLSVSRSGSLQFWPRKRTRKFLPSVNWNAVSGKGLLGFICYKVGMASAYVKDLTPDSLSKNKRIAIPVSIVECPPMKIFSVRFYKNNQVLADILNQGVEKEMRKKLKLAKNYAKSVDGVKDYDDIRLIVYSLVKKTGIKKSPDIAEIAIGGSLDEKLQFVKDNLGRELTLSLFNLQGSLVDVRGLTKAHGLSGPVKRFGIGLKQHKSEKGRRRPGSLGPWHPARVTFRTPMAGQLGMFTRIAYNSNLILKNDINEMNINPPQGFEHYGRVNTSFSLLRGSIQGSAKRQLLLTAPLRETKKTKKKKFEFIELRLAHSIGHRS